jgi:PAS domain S-box-containing protein
MAKRSQRTNPRVYDVYAQLVESWPDAVLVFDSSNQRYLFVNSAAERLVGYRRDEILRLTPVDLSHPEDAREIPAVVALADREGSVRRRWRALRKDGSVVETEMTLTRRNVDGRVVAHGVFRALADGLPAPASPAVSAEARLRILERTSLAVVMLDRDGGVTYWNAGAAEQYGVPAAEVIGRPVLELASSDAERAEVEALMERLVVHDEWVTRLTIHRRGGEPYEAMVTCSAIRSEDDELSGFLFVTAPLEAAGPSTAPRMRRARVQCAACQREVAGTMRRKYCSEKCRQWAYYHRHLEAQRERSRQRHERRRRGQGGPTPTVAAGRGA